MRKHLPSLVVAGITITIVAVVVLLMHESSSRTNQIADCLKAAGLVATISHDDGRVSLAGQDPDVQLLLGGDDDTYQARDPSEPIYVNDGTDYVAEISVPRRGAVSVSAGQTRAAAAVRHCV